MPSILKNTGFVKGQETIAGVVQNAQTRVTESSFADGRVTGTFILTGLMEGSPYEKHCSFKMAEHAYGSWCVAVVSDRGSTEEARDEFYTHAPKFRLF